MLNVFTTSENTSEHDVLNAALGGYELPSFPSSTVEALRLLRDPESTSQLITQSIEMNPALVVRVLRTVNSAAFGMSRNVGDLHRAIVMLGREQLESLVIALTIRAQLPARKIAGFSSQRFWAASARRAALARGLADLLHPQSRSEAFVAGLLQDMAIPLLAHLHAEQYSPILERWHNDTSTRLDELEQEAFGLDHSVVGAALARRWGLPDNLVNAIGGHHTLSRQPETWAIGLVSCIRETDPHPNVEHLVETCRMNYGLDPDAVVDQVRFAFEEAGELATVIY